MLKLVKKKSLNEYWDNKIKEKEEWENIEIVVNKNISWVDAIAFKKIIKAKKIKY
ncbi:hypothetical protein QET93_007435 [Akkermansia sp. N21116]|uniref:hypothetical protein n=1 Tax=Akkermansia sp. N21116 TaxID=3040764 RepID=UPI00244E9DF4|nr:hypothetical protein [Akkermansia sp. N21116]WPX39370.1 hypothetical protein QET93_007435 [Akkermansia sp. N21116]